MTDGLVTRDTGSRELAALLTPTDELSATADGVLEIDGCRADHLLERFGSPLYVVSETTLRANLRRFREAFRASWPGEVVVLYAIKANNNLAIRQIMHEEGAGGDCFGVGELYATFLGGVAPQHVVLNGSNKSPAELERAYALGVRVNIDAEDEIGLLERLARAGGRPALVNLRLKVVPPIADELGSDYFGLEPGHAVEVLEREKWGFSQEAAIPLVERMASSPDLRLGGFHLHVGRVSSELRFYEAWARALGDLLVAIRDATGFAPEMLDVGGGWARERDPESRGTALNAHSIEDYARAVSAALVDQLAEGGMPTPALWLEPGRYIVGNAVVLLGRVGAIKHDLDQTWVNVDASTNNLMRIDTSRSAYTVLPATKMHAAYDLRAHVVGPTCIDSFLAEDRELPRLERGDAIAALDAGMYAETTSTQFNGLPRPATVLARDGEAELIKERETVGDVFAKHRVPERLRAVANGAAA